MHYVTFDLETTGVNICKDQPVQIAGLVAWVDEAAKTWRLVREESFLVKLESMQVRINPKALEKHGITEEMAMDEGKDTWEAAEWWRALGLLRPVKLVGYNCLTFDYPMMVNFTERCSRQPIFKHPSLVGVVDVMHLVSPAFAGKWPKLEFAAKKYEVEVPEGGRLHEALTDVRLTWGVYCKLHRWTEIGKAREVREVGPLEAEPLVMEDKAGNTHTWEEKK